MVDWGPLVEAARAAGAEGAAVAVDGARWAADAGAITCADSTWNTHMSINK